ncbi:ATP-dependent DNA helicase RecQ [Salinimicrobium catena]|uniref:ATP-dependent DNA helicase RecQ n=1 Tax=Salinimicrobium catena TaxID=390640 RepID=A0A1H5P825_9FLAO|nr:ATP-dependent DNA helicase RecQ [Salinimicrobium catena]SDL75186.1 ATP-dependent DNA helicase RecQ [Salinimicrobium catena]SEF10025.1 ATP-dependent DNA helicase RecQ [Salinimicrobium catena]
MFKPEEILQKYWGFSSFRPLQKEVIENALSGKDVITLLPTGGGKSLCFQVPALAKDGLCIVISPLVALMEDQVNALQAKGIKAMALTGGIPFSEVDTLLDNCIYGNYKFLYLSPERLQQEIVQERIRQMAVNLIAVDEAHCISQWGHDFRPAYRNIAFLREIKPEVPVIGLTATATGKVVKDMAEQLEMKDPAILKRSFKRENLAYEVKEVQDKNYYLEKILREHEESAIIYVRSRKATIELAEFLQKKGISAASFHGGLLKKEKSERLQSWLKDEKRVMVATSAFGMGIDKPNVRSVIHMNLPESLESYFQEAGRAGRDGKFAKAVVLTNQSDIPLLKNQFLSTLPSVELVKLVYKKVVTYFRIAYGEGEGSVHHFNFYEFCSQYELNVLQTYNALLLLDRTSVLSLSEQFQKKTRIHFKVTGRQLSFYLEANPQFDAVAKAVLRTYGGAFEDMVEINLQVIANKAGTGQSEVISVLRKLHKDGIAEFEHDQHDTRVTFLLPREDEATVNPLIPYIKLQLNTKKEKIEAVLNYVANNGQCKSRQLLLYFGETDAGPCGICSVCKPSEEKLSREQMKKIYFRIVALLEEGEHSSREITEKLDFPEAHILEVLRVLVEKEALSLTPAKKYKLKHL